LKYSVSELWESEFKDNIWKKRKQNFFKKEEKENTQKIEVE